MPYLDPERKAARAQWRRDQRWIAVGAIPPRLRPPKPPKVVERKPRTPRPRQKSGREVVLEAKSVACADCGRTFPAVCMDFDHVRGVKVANVSKMEGSAGRQALLDEIAKCDVVCACCHRIRTAERVNRGAPRSRVATHPPPPGGASRLRDCAPTSLEHPHHGHKERYP